MKKFIFSLIATFMFAIGTINAQNAAETNYAGSSKFFDNWSVTLQGGVVTGMDNFFSGHTATTPIVVLGADKYITPAFGVGIDARTAIGTGCELHNPHTAFDAFNINGYAKVNVRNLFNYKGSRRTFEPIAYVGLGWGHNNCSAFPALSSNYNAGIAGVPTELYGPALRNYVTGRAGVELNFNLGKTKAWGIVVNPSVVWGNIDNLRLCKQNGNFEVTAGVVYHFKTSNGTHDFAKVDVAGMNKRINDLIAENEALKHRRPRVVEKIVEKSTSTTMIVQSTYVVTFEFDKADLSDTAKAELNKVPANSTVVIDAYASPEGSEAYNVNLSENRANSVKAYLEGRNVTVKSVASHGAVDKFSNRIAIVNCVK